MTTDDLIREALAKQADRAPAPHAVLAALHRPRRNRRPLLVALVVAASVVAAVTFAVNRAPIEPAPPARPGQVVGLRHEPGWLPVGLTERFRYLNDPEPGYGRAWQDGTRRVDLAVHPLSTPPVGLGLYDRSTDRVDLGAQGEGAYLATSEPATYAVLAWKSGGDLLQLGVHDAADVRETARRIAVSMGDDGTGRLAEVIHPGPELLPVHSSGDRVERRWTGTSPTDWTVEYERWHFSHVTVVRLTPASPDTAGGRTVRAHGVDATYVPPRQQDGGTTAPLLVVPVGSGFLTIGGRSSQIPDGDLADLPLEELVAIADTTVVDDPDVSWFGTR